MMNIPPDTGRRWPEGKRERERGGRVYNSERGEKWTYIFVLSHRDVDKSTETLFCVGNRNTCQMYISLQDIYK